MQERAAYKRFAVTGALLEALTVRLGDGRRAGVLADAGVRAYYDGFAAWIVSGKDGPLSDAVVPELRAYGSAVADMMVPRFAPTADHK